MIAFRIQKNQRNVIGFFFWELFDFTNQIGFFCSLVFGVLQNLGFIQFSFIRFSYRFIKFIDQIERFVKLLCIHIQRNQIFSIICFKLDQFLNNIYSLIVIVGVITNIIHAHPSPMVFRIYFCCFFKIIIGLIIFFLRQIIFS